MLAMIEKRLKLPTIQEKLLSSKKIINKTPPEQVKMIWDIQF